MRTKLPKRTTILETWEPVYERYWDSGLWRPRIDIEQVLTDGTRYAVMEYSKARPMGPYATVTEAVQKHGLLYVVHSTKAIVCRRIETNILARLLVPDHLRVGFRLAVNGELYTLTPARIFGRCRNQDGAARYAAALGIENSESATYVT